MSDFNVMTATLNKALVEGAKLKKNNGSKKYHDYDLADFAKTMAKGIRKDVSSKVAVLVKSLDMDAPVRDMITKAGYDLATGLQDYDLQRPVKLVYPVYLPLRNMIPRQSGEGGDRTHWKKIDKINTANLAGFTAEGLRGIYTTDELVSEDAVYVTMALDTIITEEARLAAGSLADALQVASFNLMNSFLIAQEKAYYGANGTTALAQTGTPASAVQSQVAGNSLTGTISIKAVAMTADGYNNWVAAGGVPAANSSYSVTAVTLPTTITGTTGGPAGQSITYNAGYSQASTALSVTLTGSNNTIQFKIPALAGAVAYAIFWGASGSEVIGAVSTTNLVTIGANATGTQNASAFATNYSQNTYAFDGVIALNANAFNTNGSASTLGAYYKSLDGLSLTPNGRSGVVEIENMLIDRWNKFQLGVDEMYVNAQQFSDIATCVIGNGGKPLSYYQGSITDNHTSVGGSGVFKYFSPFANNPYGNVINIVLHPCAVPGIIVAVSYRLPFMVNTIAQPLQVHTQRDVWEREWPQYDDTYQYTVFSREVLVDYFTPSLSVIANIGPGVTSIS